MSVSELLLVLRSNIKLGGEPGQQLRQEAARGLAGASLEAQHCATIADKRMGGLVLLCALSTVRDEATASDAMSAVINVLAWANDQGEREFNDSLERIISAGGITAAATRAVSDSKDPQVQVVALMFLRNATRVEKGAEALAKQTDLSRRLVLAFARRRRFEQHEEDEWTVEFGQCLRNLTAKSSDFRASMLRRSTGVLASLLPQLLSSNDYSRARRLGVAEALHHCALAEKEEHWFLLTELFAAHHILYALLDSADVEKLEVDARDKLRLKADSPIWHPQSAGRGHLPIPAELAERVAIGDKTRETDGDVTLVLLDTLVCFCATRRGREKLRAIEVYSVFRDTDYFFAGESKETTDESKSLGVMVTLDEEANKGDESKWSEADKISDKISHACSELADLLNREERSTPVVKTTDELATGAANCKIAAPQVEDEDDNMDNFAAAASSSADDDDDDDEVEPPQSKKQPAPPPAPVKKTAGLFDGLKGAFESHNASDDGTSTYDIPD